MRFDTRENKAHKQGYKAAACWPGEERKVCMRRRSEKSCVENDKLLFQLVTMLCLISLICIGRDLQLLPCYTLTEGIFIFILILTHYNWKFTVTYMKMYHIIKIGELYLIDLLVKIFVKKSE